MNDNRRYDNDRSRESRARQDAYQEYLSLREHNEDRGSYVKDDTLYGSYIPNRSETVGSISPRRNLTVPADFIHL